MTIAKVGGEWTKQALEREAEEEVQNDVAAQPLGIASDELPKMRRCVHHFRHHVDVQHHPSSWSILLRYGVVFFPPLDLVLYPCLLRDQIKVKPYFQTRPCLLDVAMLLCVLWCQMPFIVSFTVSCDTRTM